MPSADEFRRLALSLDGAVEKAHMGHPDFRAAGRIFASLHADGRSGALKLTPAEQRALVREHREAFAPAAGAWGRQGWTTVRLEAADEAAIRGALILAWENVTARPPARRARPAAGGQRKRR
jgi:hypothetical protein